MGEAAGEGSVKGLERAGLGLWGGGDIGQKKSIKSSLLANNTQRLITTKQTKPKPVALCTAYYIINKGGSGNILLSLVPQHASYCCK